MSKHRRRNGERYIEQQNKNSNFLGNNPNQQLMDIIGSIGNGDMSQIASLLSSLNGEGVNLNNLNMGANTSSNNINNNSNNNMVNRNMNNMQQQEFNPLQLLFSGLVGNMPFGNNNLKKDQNQSNLNKGSSVKKDTSEEKVEVARVETEVDNAVIEEIEKEKIENIDLENKEITKIENIELNSDKIIAGDDDNINMLKSLKVLVDPKKRKFIDKIIKLYLDGEFNDVI